MVQTPETVEVNVVMGAQLRAIVRSALIHVKNAINDGMAESGLMGERRVTKIIDEELTKWPATVGPEPEDTLPQWLYWRFGRHMESVVGPENVKEWSQLSEEDVKYWHHEAAAVRRAVGRGGYKSHRKGSGFVLSTPINELHQKANVTEYEAVKDLRPLDLKNAEDLAQAIRIAVGAASTCWTNMSGAGVFKSEEALDISTQLEHEFYRRLSLNTLLARHQEVMEYLQKLIGQGQPNVSVVQMGNLLTGRTTTADYTSALQPEPSHTKRCWCGGEVGQRSPGDESGLGCMRNVTHNWRGMSSEAPRTPGYDGPEGTEWTGGKAHG